MKLSPVQILFLILLFNHCLLLKFEPPNLRYSIKEVAEAVNWAREKPQEMKEYIKKHWYDDLDTKTGTCIVKSWRLRLNEPCPEQFDSLFEFYDKQEPLKALQLNKAVTWGAYQQAHHLATEVHSIGHGGPLTLFQRYGSYATNFIGAVGENVLAEGGLKNTAKHMIARFILDDGVKSRGHRKNIYGYETLGVGLAADSKKPDTIYLVLGFSTKHDCGKCDDIPLQDSIDMGWASGVEGHKDATSLGTKSSTLYQFFGTGLIMLFALHQMLI